MQLYLNVSSYRSLFLINISTLLFRVSYQAMFPNILFIWLHKRPLCFNTFNRNHWVIYCHSTTFLNIYQRIKCTLWHFQKWWHFRPVCRHESFGSTVVTTLFISHSLTHHTYNFVHEFRNGCLVRTLLNRFLIADSRRKPIPTQPWPPYHDSFTYFKSKTFGMFHKIFDKSNDKVSGNAQ